jgi:hypothetical protein
MGAGPRAARNWVGGYFAGRNLTRLRRNRRAASHVCGVRPALQRVASHVAPQGTASFLNSRRSPTIITLTNVSSEMRCLPQQTPRGCVPAEPHDRFLRPLLPKRTSDLLIVDVLKHWRRSITVLRPEDNVLPARRPRHRQFNPGGLANTA